MVTFRSRTLGVRLLPALVCLAVSVLALPRDVYAQGGERPRHARLSSDLRQRIANGDSRDETVILTGTPERVRRIAARHRLSVKKWLVNGAVLDVPAHAVAGLADDQDVDQLSTNQFLRANDGLTNDVIGADEVQAGTWDAEGGGEAFNGQGVGVALIDSGVALMPQLAGRIVARLDFTKAGGWGLDAYGHGTHVAGIIASKAGAWKGDGGVSPGAHIVSLKVLDENGVGTADNVIEAIDWAIANRAKFKLKVINLSLGGPVLQPAADDPLCQAVERAYRAGLVVVASAGNFGKAADGRKVYGGITTPGISPYAITVGALNTKQTLETEDDEVASYSSRGPTRFDHLIKPDLVAPGNKIESLAAPNSTLVKKYPELVTGKGWSARLTLSGTSMAAGVTSGAVALIFHAHPSAGPFSMRAAIQLGSVSTDQGLLQEGSGSLYVPGSLGLSVDPHGTVFARSELWVEAFENRDAALIAGSAGAEGHTVVWGSHDTVVWGSNWDLDNTVVWGSTDTVVWGSSETVVWGNSWDFDNTVVWGSSWDVDNTVVWGSFDSDNTVVWGSSDETVVWGSSAFAAE